MSTLILNKWDFGSIPDSITSDLQTLNTWALETSAVFEPCMIGQFWAQQRIPGWILSNFHLNNISVAQKLAELEPGERCWRNTWTGPDLCGRTAILVCLGGITLCSWKQARNNWKTSKIWTKKNCSNGPPFGSFSRGKIKMAHLLPERSARREDHFLQTWSLLSGALD